MNCFYCLLLIFAVIVCQTDHQLDVDVDVGVHAADQQFTCLNTGHVPLVHYGWQRNDGICDCCDGSDERQGTCPNTCQAMQQQQKEILEKLHLQHAAGRRKQTKLLLGKLGSADDQQLRQSDCPYRRWLMLNVLRPPHTVTVTVTKYIDKQDNDSMLHKDAHQIWHLLPKCFKAIFGKYEYEFCPFSKVTQIDLQTGQRVSLGLYTTLQSNLMFFEHGQSCWRGPSRQTRVEMQCAEVDQIVSVEEPEVCSYLIVFKTCAVC